jgi:glycosyltransferase involved in cell wall biosynthesis
MRAPSISVITPTLNAIRFIDACVESVIAEGPVVLEHLILDGGSTDGTVERINELCLIHPRLRLFPGPGLGQSEALNKGSDAAKGKYISILNVDDFYEPGALAEMASLLSRENPPAMVVGDCRVVDEHDQIKFINRPEDLRLEALLLGWRFAQHPVNPSAYLYHRECHRIVGGFDENEHYAMDLEFMFTAASRIRLVYYPKIWGNFRLIPGAKTYEDRDGVQRALKIRHRHIAKLSTFKRAKMNFIRISKYAKRRLSRLTAMMDRALTFGRDGKDRTPEAIEEQTYRAARSWWWKARSWLLFQPNARKDKSQRMSAYRRRPEVTGRRSK